MGHQSWKSNISFFGRLRIRSIGLPDRTGYHLPIEINLTRYYDAFRFFRKFTVFDKPKITISTPEKKHQKRSDFFKPNVALPAQHDGDFKKVKRFFLIASYFIEIGHPCDTIYFFVFKKKLFPGSIFEHSERWAVSGRAKILVVLRHHKWLMENDKA